MLSWLKNEIKNTFYVLCWLFASKQPHEVNEIIKKYSPRDAFDLYESVLRELEKSGFNANCTVITSFENIHILDSVGLIIRDEKTTKLWLRGRSSTEPTAKAIQISGSIYHGNHYGNLVYGELPDEPKEA